jgi:hypothetical protein
VLKKLIDTYDLQFGKEVEERCLRMFIRGLTSDINAQEAAKKTKQLKGGHNIFAKFSTRRKKREVGRAGLPYLLVPVLTKIITYRYRCQVPVSF